MKLMYITDSSYKINALDFCSPSMLKDQNFLFSQGQMVNVKRLMINPTVKKRVISEYATGDIICAG